MRNINFLTLHADAAGLRIMVLANRLASTTETERLLHDWVEQHLARFIRFTRKALAAERRVLLNNDPQQDADLGEELYNYQATYRDFWCEEDGYDLLDYVPLEMVEFRALLGVPEDKLDRFADFNKHCLKPALEEVNHLTDFEVGVIAIKKGRTVEKLGLSWMKKSPRALQRAFDEREKSRVGRKARWKGDIEVLTPASLEDA